MTQPPPEGAPPPPAAPPQYAPPSDPVPGYPGSAQPAPQHAPPSAPDSTGAPQSPPQYHTPVQYQPPQYASPVQYQRPQYQLPPQYQPPAAPGYAAPGVGAPYYPGLQATAPGAGGVFDGAVHPGELRRPLYGANIGQAFSRFFRNYVSFRGRASRSELWWMMLVYWLAYFGLSILTSIITSIGFGGRDNVIDSVLGFITLVIVLGSTLPWLAIGWRRLHDANLPGPLFLLNLIPFAGQIAVLVLLTLSPKPEGRRFDPPER